MTHIVVENPMTDKQRKYLEDVPLKFSGKIANPTLRRQFTEAYVYHIATQLGIDDGAAAYRGRLEAAVERIVANTDTLIAATALSLLATSVEAQADNALHIRDMIAKTGIAAALEKPWQAAMGEIAIHGINNSSTVRMAIIDYLTSPLNQKSLDRIYGRLRPNRFMMECQYEWEMKPLHSPQPVG